MRFIAFSLTISALLSAPADTSSATTAFKSTGVVESAAVEEDGSAWFTTWDEDARFVIRKVPDDQAERLKDLLQTSVDTTRSIVVTFDPSEARLSADGAKLDLPVCSVALEEKNVTLQSNCPNNAIDGRTLSKSPVLAVALGWAEVRRGFAREAIEPLDLALVSKSLSPALTVIALRARAAANEQIAYDELTRGQHADRWWVDALLDNRKLEALRPNDLDLRISEAIDLERLGDYAGAAAIYHAALGKWPNEKYRLTVRLAAVARHKGDNDRSLELLNTLPAEFGPDLGMKFYYHRGWTLVNLGRFDEAIADFTEGLKAQPDYQWAYIRRGCAYAGIGKLNFAVGDLETAVGILDAAPFNQGEAAKHDVVGVKHLIDGLKAIPEGTNLPNACDAIWGPDDISRPRSPLLQSI